MKSKQSFVVASAAVFMLGCGVANAGDTIEESGVMALVIDKWDESEPNKGHKLVDYAGRCVALPDDPSAIKAACDCVGKYEYMQDGSWKGAGTCTVTFKGGDTLKESWERVPT